MDCDAIRPNLAAYALGVLDDTEATAAADHLSGCPACRAELAGLESAASVLPAALAAASPVRPPERIKDRLLVAIGDTWNPDVRPVPTMTTSSPNHVGDRAAVGETAFRRDDPFGPLASEPALLPVPLWRRPLAWGGLAAAVLLAASFAWGVRLSEALDRERELRQAVAGFFADQQAIVFEVVDAETTERRVLFPPAGSDFPTRPYGKIFTRADMAHVVAMANRLPDAPPGEAFHLWVTLDGRTHHAGVLAPNEDGFAVLVFDADRPGPAYSAAWITRQPADATQPGGLPVVAWQIDEE